MKLRLSAIPLLILFTATAFASPGADSYRQGIKAEQQGTYDVAAELFEHAARRLTGQKSAEAWFRAGRDWVDADNPKQSYGRAMACFQRVDLAVARLPVVRETKTWVSVLSKLVSAEDAAQEAERLKSALEDAAEGSRALHPTRR